MPTKPRSSSRHVTIKRSAASIRGTPLHMRIILTLSLAGLTGALPICSQTPGPTSSHSVPIFHVTVIERTLKAVNYQHHAGPTRVDMKGTVLLPKAQGEVVVEVKSGYTELSA